MQLHIPFWDTYFWYHSPSLSNNNNKRQRSSCAHNSRNIIQYSWYCSHVSSITVVTTIKQIYKTFPGGSELGHHWVKWWLAASWWRHQMETFSALLVICAGNSPVPVISPHKGQWRRVLMFSLICTRINGWVNNGEAGDLRRNRTHYDVTVMYSPLCLNRNQFKLLLNGNLGTNFGGIWIKMRLFYGQEDAFGNVVCKTATILSRPQYAILLIFEGNTHEQIWIIILWSTKE